MELRITIPFVARTYGDRCGIARALDLVGERWALLVVRELLLGPKRFTDLRAGLPHVGPDVLAQRLRELQAAGIVRRRRLPPPVPAQVYELTDARRRARAGRARARSLGQRRAGRGAGRGDRPRRAGRRPQDALRPRRGRRPRRDLRARARRAPVHASGSRTAGSTSPAAAPSGRMRASRPRRARSRRSSGTAAGSTRRCAPGRWSCRARRHASWSCSRSRRGRPGARWADGWWTG